LPAIVILIGMGLLLGPITGVITPSHSPEALNAMIGLGVAIILFEGGMDLKLGELRHSGSRVGRMVFIGAPLAWGLGAVAAHYVAGLSWPVAIVLAAILVVTGPTVILPLLRQARLNKETAWLFKWEGIVNDPLGVLLAVISFQYFTSSRATTLTASLQDLGLSMLVGLVMGGGGGWLTGWLYRRGAVPVHLKAPILMVLVLLIYWASNLMQHEAGLLAVTLMGMVIGNMSIVERQALQTFKENLTVVLLSILFIVIPAQLGVQHLAQIDWRAILFVLVLLFLVRPLAVMTAMLGSSVPRETRWLLAWIAPRGIVAAATASIFGPQLVEAGYPDAERLLPIVFLVIMTTVLVHGLTLRPLARRLKLSAGEPNGLLIVGGSPFSVALAIALRRLGLEVKIADGAWDHLKEARMAGVPVFYGEVLSEETAHTLDAKSLNHLLAATENDFYNALVCKGAGRLFGHHRTFQLSAHSASDQEFKRLSIDMRGYFAFDAQANFTLLNRRIAEGWAIQQTKVSEQHRWAAMKERLDATDPEWMFLGGVTPKGEFRLYSQENRFKVEPDWTALYFAPPTVRTRHAEGENSANSAPVALPAAEVLAK
jgi:CPA1 family monovalent cation:H+ antiporter